MTARELALALLEQRFGASPCMPPDSSGLADFQLEARARLRIALQRYHGALLADSVGLGKTHVAAALARDYAPAGEPVLAIVPASLRRLWHRALHGLNAVIITHARLSRGRVPDLEHAGFIIVDEAHGFRNPATQRYAALARLIAGHPVLLLSATPVNNSLWDLYWLLRLFATDDAFAQIGVPDLYACFDAAQRSGTAGRVPAVLGEVALRRTRVIVNELYDDLQLGHLSLRFPRREPPRPVSYELAPELLSLLPLLTQDLHFTPWRLAGSASAVTLLRLNLLKRLESSTAALEQSLRAIERALHDFLRALAGGRLLVPQLQAEKSDPAQLSFVPLVARPLSPAHDAQALAAAAAAERQRVRAALRALGRTTARDPKLAALIALLEGELKGRPVLLFTEYRATAEYLHARLHRLLPTALIHGTGARLGAAPAGRRTIIERFAPRANHAREPPAAQRVQLLIATDVLAEGMNLQDAADVISFDLPWNPMRIVQRLGRVDRLGSAHAAVRGWYFVPDRGLERLLGLEQRLRRKLRRAHHTIGLDGAVLAPRNRAHGSSLMNLVAVGDPRAFAEAERADASLFAAEERLRAAYRRALAPNALAALPLGLAGRPDASSAPRPTHGPRAARAVPFFELRGFVPPGPARHCVLFQVGPAQRAVFVGRGRAFEDDVAWTELLLHALEQPAVEQVCSLPMSHPLIGRAARALRPGPCTRPPPGLRNLRTRLLQALQEMPGGATPEECARVQTVLQRIARPLPGRTPLRRLARTLAGEPLPRLLEAVERILDDGPTASPPVRNGDRARLPRPVPAAVFSLPAG